MIFIALLVLTTMALAGAAGFFAVVGLAAIFSGTFWSVVFMGGALEAGKLMAASYLYRYWEHTNIWLKTYLMAGILALMLLTSVGIFGYLSAGYQTDVLPLKQMEEQVQMLEQERTRLVDRKVQINNQIAQLPPHFVSGRTRLIREFRSEQTALINRIAELDAQIVEMRGQFIEKQAHVGPIIYIASVFGLDTDNATKYMIFLIIFAFDPMAVALTLATNIAIRRREEEKAALKKQQKLEEEQKAKEQRELELAEKAKRESDKAEAERAAAAAALATVAVPAVARQEPEPPQQPEPVSRAQVVSAEVKPETDVEEVVEEIVEVIDDKTTRPGYENSTWTAVEHEVEEPQSRAVEQQEPIVQEDPFRQESENTEESVATVEPQPGPEKEEYVVRRRMRPYTSINTALSESKIDELVQHYMWLKEKRDSGDSLTQDDRWEMSAIEEILRKHGMGMYIG